MKRENLYLFLWVLSLLLLSPVKTALAQTTAFTYQGELQASGVNANGNHDFEFRLFDTLAGGTQQGPTVTANAINVTDGVFTTTLDFGNQYPAANRYLQTSVRPSGGGGYTLLSPRQQLTSAPFAVNALTLQGLDSSGFVRNSSSEQIGANFNIDGSGYAAIFNATDQYSFRGTHILSARGVDNLSAGRRAGENLANGPSNVFVGAYAGRNTTDGSQNAFVGTSAGQTNIDGVDNSFLGRAAGRDSTGDNNTFVGSFAGGPSTTGGSNTFVGALAGIANRSGSSNTMLGQGANLGASNLSFATAVGAQATVASSNTIMLGRSTDRVIAPGTLIVGNRTVGRGDMSVYANSGNADFYMQGSASTTGINMGVSSSATNEINFYISHYNGTTYQDRLQITPTGSVKINVLGSGGGTSLCQNASNEIATCSSSLRYKLNVEDLNSGLDLVEKLRPVYFNWKADNMADIGLVAEEVSKAEPLLVTTNEAGEIEGVKYDRIAVVLVEAVKEQQTVIEALRVQLQAQEQANQAQQDELILLKQLVCASNVEAKTCREPPNLAHSPPAGLQ